MRLGIAEEEVQSLSEEIGEGCGCSAAVMQNNAADV